jgi:hypothetical protein
VTKREPKSLSNFQPSDHAFNVTAYELRVVHGWLPDPVGQTTEPRFSVHIDGTAIANEAHVCVIGEEHRSEEFALTIYSDPESTRKWIPFRKSYDEICRSNFKDAPVCEFLRLQFDCFDKAPPTAMLSFIDYNWTLECVIPTGVLETLRTSVQTGHIDFITFSINWVGGLVDEYNQSVSRIDSRHKVIYNRLGLGLFGTDEIETWGMFTLPEGISPEPLWGFISALEWTPARAGIVSKRPSSGRLVQLRDRWIGHYTQAIKGELKYPSTYGFGPNADRFRRLSDRALSVLYLVIEEMPTYCTNTNMSEYGLSIEDFLFDTLRFIATLDDALHSYNGPFFEERFQIWSHRERFQFKFSQVEDFIVKRPTQAAGISGCSDALTSAITEYIQKPLLHNAYLDWVILDAMTFGKVVALTHEALMARRGGAYWAAYFLGGVGWGTLILWPLVWLIKWGLPAVVCYFIAQRSVSAGIATGAVWYGLYVLWLLIRLWTKVSERFTFNETLAQKMRRLLGEALEAYSSLRGPIMHVPVVRRAFEQATERGVLWDHATAYILDRLSHNTPELWSNVPPRSRE